MLVIDRHHSLTDVCITLTFRIQKPYYCALFDLDTSLYGKTLHSINFLYRDQDSLLNALCCSHLLLRFVTLFGGAAVAAGILTQSHVFTFHLDNPYRK